MYRLVISEGVVMKRCMVECIGTFFLTLAISLTGNPIAIGLMLMTMIYIGGHISGGHFNPAVSFAFFLEKRLTSHWLLKYWLAQAIGASLALCVFMLVTCNMFVPEMVTGTSVMLAAFIEGLFAMAFCWVILTMHLVPRYKDAHLAGMVIGLTLTAIAFVGGLFNPAVAVGSFVCNLVKNGICLDAPTMIVYMISPLIGGLAASYLFNCFNTDQQRF